jgi:hypothetical protein
MPRFASFADIIFCRRLTDGSKIEPHEKGGEHDFAAAGFPLGSDTGAFCEKVESGIPMNR